MAYDFNQATELIRRLLGVAELPDELLTLLELSKANEGYRPYFVAASYLDTQPQLIRVDNFTFSEGSQMNRVALWLQLQKQLDGSLSGISPDNIIGETLTFITSDLGGIYRV